MFGSGELKFFITHLPEKKGLLISCCAFELNSIRTDAVVSGVEINAQQDRSST